MFFTGILLMTNLSLLCLILTLNLPKELTIAILKFIPRRMWQILLLLLRKMQFKLYLKLILLLIAGLGESQLSGKQRVSRSNVLEGQVTMVSLIFQFPKCSLWLKMWLNKSIKCSQIVPISILEVMRYLLLVGIKDLPYKSSWNLKILAVMENYRCIGENRSNQCYHHPEKLFFGEMTDMTSPQLQIKLFSSGEVKGMLPNVFFILYSHCKYN